MFGKSGDYLSLDDTEERVARELKSTGSSIEGLIDKLSTPQAGKYDIFISYSYADDIRIPVSSCLRFIDAGFFVYLPKRLDRKLNRSPKLEQIRKTQSALESSKSLVMINGPSTSRSQWIPWEIGYMSGRTGKVAIQSVADENNKIVNREFLRLYPSVNFDGVSLNIGFPESGGQAIQAWLDT